MDLRACAAPFVPSGFSVATASKAVAARSPRSAEELQGDRLIRLLADGALGPRPPARRDIGPPPGFDSFPSPLVDNAEPQEQATCQWRCAGASTAPREPMKVLQRIARPALEEAGETNADASCTSSHSSLAGPATSPPRVALSAEALFCPSCSSGQPCAFHRPPERPEAGPSSLGCLADCMLPTTRGSPRGVAAIRRCATVRRWSCGPSAPSAGANSTAR
mmetsp:Transcript_71036/g.179260  ORF Transcript_71036/g.179260 Transcript_71036/m.179260 type:complete len:220 (+) Transcript_71036:91-750(+)